MKSLNLKKLNEVELSASAQETLVGGLQATSMESVEAAGKKSRRWWKCTKTCTAYC